MINYIFALTSLSIVSFSSHQLISMQAVNQEHQLTVLEYHGACVNDATILNGTALIEAAFYGHIERVKALIEQGADVNATDSFGKSALTIAALYERTRIAKMLMRHGAVIAPNLPARDKDTILQLLTRSISSILVQAIVIRDSDAVKRLLARESLTTQDEFGMTALHWAVAQNYEELVQDLLTVYKPHLTLRDNEGNTALHLAARNGNNSILQVLLAHGADINVQNRQGNTALHLVTQAGNGALIQQLLRAGARTAIRNADGNTMYQLIDRHPDETTRDELRKIVLARALNSPVVLRDLMAPHRQLTSYLPPSVAQNILCFLPGYSLPERSDH